MPAIIEGPPERGEPARPLWLRLGWFLVLAAAGTAATALAAYGLRLPLVLLHR